MTLTLDHILNPISQMPFGLLLIALFIVGYIPIPVPNEFLATMVLAYDKQSQFPILIQFMTVMALSELAWGFTVFYLVKEHIHKIKLPRARPTLPRSHWLNKYGMITFIFSHGTTGLLITPTLSAVVPYLNDVLIGIVAHRGGSYRSFLIYFVVGTVIRTVIGIMILKVSLGL